VPPSVACPALQYFSALPHKLQDFRKKKLLDIKLFLFSIQILFALQILSHSKKTSARYHNRCTQVFMWSTRYCCQISVDVNSLSCRFSKNPQVSNFMKIHPVGAELFHTDTHDAANSRYSRFLRTHLKTAKKKHGKAGPTTAWFSNVIWYVYKQLGKTYPAFLINKTQLFSCVCHKSPTCSCTTCPWRPITIKLTAKHGRR
jgi:hypothetical protein